MMSWVKSGDLIVIVVMGGIGALFGPLYGADRLLRPRGDAEAVPRLSAQGWGEYWQIVFGPLLVIIALYARGGMASLLRSRA
jgi:branched-chain amino acid transport system permease protein